MKLSDEKIREFRNNGAMKLGQLLTPEEVEEGRRRFDAMFSERVGTSDRGLRNLWAADDSREQQLKTERRHYQMVNLWQSDEWYRSLIYRDDLLDKVESVLGPNIQLLHDQVFFKPANDGAESPYHIDASYWSYSPLNLVSIWITLDDTDLENSCLHFVLGSHREPPPKMKRWTMPSGVEAIEAIVEDGRAVPFIMKAGEGLMHHCQTIHGARANNSDRLRRALGIHYFASGIKDPQGNALDGPNHPLLRGQKVGTLVPAMATP